MADSDISLNRGLQGIYLDRTNTTFIDGKEGVLEYSGYNIHDLAENSTFEETSYLLMYGNLPNTTQLEEFDKSLKSYRKLPQKTYDIIDIVKDSHPMDVLRTAISSLSSYSSFLINPLSIKPSTIFLETKSKSSEPDGSKRSANTVAIKKSSKSEAFLFIILNYINHL